MIEPKPIDSKLKIMKQEFTIKTKNSHETNQWKKVEYDCSQKQITPNPNSQKKLSDRITPFTLTLSDLPQSV